MTVQNASQLVAQASAQSSAFDSLNARLSQLEKSQKRWRLLAALSLAAAGVPWILGAGGNAEPTNDLPRDMKVSSLTLVGPDGVEHANLKLDRGSPVLILHQDDRQAMLTVADGNAGLACAGASGVVFAGVSKEAAYFNARGSDFKAGVFAGVDTQRLSSFRAYGSDMNVAASLDVTDAGTPSFTLNDPKTGTTQLPAPR